MILPLLPTTTFSISLVICNISIGLNNGYIIVRWLADSMYKTTPSFVCLTSYLTLAIMCSSHPFCNVSILSSLKTTRNSAFLWSDLIILLWFLSSFWIQFIMIVFLVLAILGELSILLHNTQPNSSLKPLQIVQVSSLFDYYSIASTIIKPQRVKSSFNSEQHNSISSCPCIPYSLFPSWPKCWFSTSRWGVRKEQQVCSEVDEDSISQTLQQRKEVLSTARSLLSQPIHQLRLSYSNEKKCFQQLVPYYLNPFINSVCRSASDLIDFLNNNRKDLFLNCQDPQPYSHCQEFYVVTYDTMKDECSSFRRKPCMIHDGCSLSHAR